MKRHPLSTKAPASNKPARRQGVHAKRESAAPWDKMVELSAADGCLSLSGGDFAFTSTAEEKRQSELH